MRWPSFGNASVNVHLWLAIILSLPVIVIGLPGSALLLQREILAHSVPSAMMGEGKPIPEIVSAAQPNGARQWMGGHKPELDIFVDSILW